MIDKTSLFFVWLFISIFSIILLLTVLIKGMPYKTSDPANLSQIVKSTTYIYNKHSHIGLWESPKVFVDKTHDYVYYLRKYSNTNVTLHIEYTSHNVMLFNKAYSDGKRYNIFAPYIYCSDNGHFITHLIIEFTKEEAISISMNDMFVLYIKGMEDDFIMYIPGTYFFGFLYVVKNNVGIDKNVLQSQYDSLFPIYISPVIFRCNSK